MPNNSLRETNSRVLLSNSFVSYQNASNEHTFTKTRDGAVTLNNHLIKKKKRESRLSYHLRGRFSFNDVIHLLMIQ